MSIQETIGIVISNKMDKTATIITKNPITHKKYGKIIRKTNKYYAHDPSNQCKIGDTVRIQETRPLSKNKRWKIIKVIERT